VLSSTLRSRIFKKFKFGWIMNKEDANVILKLISGLDYVYMHSSNTGEDFYICLGCASDSDGSSEICHEEDCLWERSIKILEKQ